ncbi:MAG: lpxD [Chlamydiales bacterium]|jgi:UDP-3-O-[3-hydroxymyristoyl] glucosamine N-acyltransferase|nr:lpxD [Chlamydiales bacterium]
MPQKKFSLKELAEITSCQLLGDEAKEISGIADLVSATPEQASFLANSLYQKKLEASQAGVIIIGRDVPPPPHKNVLISADPNRSFQRLICLFLNDEKLKSGFMGIHPTAVIHERARIAPTASIGPYAVIDQYAEVQDHTRIDSHVSIGAGCRIGRHCHLHSHVVLREGCELGDHVILQPGVVIGACGFGYQTVQGVHEKLEQLGKVVIESHVEVGANSTIDRARFQATRIGRGTKIDNLVMIAHGVEIGVGNIIVSQVGIAGSTRTGSYVVLGGQVGVVGHVEIADQVMVAASSGVTKSLLTPKEKYGGHPAIPLKEHLRQQALLKGLPKLLERVKRVESLLGG